MKTLSIYLLLLNRDLKCAVTFEQFGIRRFREAAFAHTCRGGTLSKCYGFFPSGIKWWAGSRC
jgi:hypothetical protein